MNSFGKLVVNMGLIFLLSVMPLAAQIENGVDFTTSFPFYAGNTRMPAGSYKITPSGFDTSLLLIESKDRSYPRSLILYRRKLSSLTPDPMSTSRNTETLTF
jgi:hypothetical protein